MALFTLGKIVATPGALDALSRAGQSPEEFLKWHVQGEWGDLNLHDIEANRAALQEGERLLSCYKTALGEVIWIITEADRASTCILLPEDY